MPMLEERKVYLITSSSDCSIFATNSDEYFAFFFNFPSQQFSQKAVSTGISPRGTLVDMYAAQTHTDHVTDWENSLKQIGP